MPPFTTRVGNVPTANLQRATYREGQPIEAFGSDIAQGLAQLGVGISAYGENVGRARSFEAERNFTIWMGTQERAHEEALQNAPTNWEGFSQSRSAELKKAQEEFIASVPAELREQYLVRTEQVNQGLMSSSLKSEIQGRTKYQAGALQETMQEFQRGVHNNPGASDLYRAQWNAMVDKSTLPQEMKDAAKLEGERALLEAEYVGESLLYSEGILRPENVDGSDVVYAESTVQRAFLNTVAGPESGGSYTAIVYGGDLTDFSDHPRVYKRRPDGRPTSAAGRYQFTASTWDEVATELGLKDFSPASQDQAAWHLAQKRYRSKTGRDLSADLASGDRELIKGARAALAGTWEGFKGMSDDEFANSFLGGKGVRGVQAAHAVPPDIWNDEKYEPIPHDTKFQLERYSLQLANQARSERAAQAKAVYGERFNATLVSARAGQMSEGEVEQAASTWVTDFDDQVKLRKAYNDYLKEDQDIRAFQTGVARPDAIFSYTNADNRQQWDAYYEKFLKQGVEARDPSVIADVIAPLAQKTKMFAPKLMQDLTGLAQSENVADVTYAMNAMATLEDSANAAWQAAATEEQISNLQWWRNEGKYYQNAENPEDLILRLNRRTDSRFEQTRQLWLEVGEKYAREELDVDKIVGSFGGYFTADPELPPSAQVSAAFQTVYRGIFLEEMQRYGDPEKAMAAATKVIKKRWGVTEVGGRKRLIEYAPETIYPSFGGDHQWIEDQARLELSQQDSRFIDTGTEFILIPDGKTSTEYETFQRDPTTAMPSYIVTVISEDGQIEPLRNAEGKVTRWRGKITPEMEFKMEQSATEKHLRVKMQRLNNELVVARNLKDEKRVTDLKRQIAGIEQSLEVGFENLDEDIQGVEVTP